MNEDTPSQPISESEEPATKASQTGAAEDDLSFWTGDAKAHDGAESPKQNRDESSGFQNSTGQNLEDEGFSDEEKPSCEGENSSADMSSSAKPDATAPDWEEVVKALQDEISGLEDQRLRALADLENMRRQSAKDKEAASKFAIQGFASSMLDVADNVERALSAIPSDSRENKDIMPLVVGLEMIAKSFKSTFEKNGLSRIETVGSTFDPNLHQAMQEVEDRERPPGTIAAEFQAGYSLNGRLLRPAMVAVVKAAPPEHVDQTA